MVRQVIGIGSSANDGTGDPARTAGIKANANFAELYAAQAQSAVRPFYRTMLLGDSHIAYSLRQPVAVTGFTVTGGVATLTFAGNHYIRAGQRFGLYNVGIANTAHPDNGTCPLAVTSAGGSSNITFATTAANGNQLTSGTWQVTELASNTENGIVTWIQNFTRHQMMVTHDFAAINSTAAFWVAGLSKLPTSGVDVVVVSLGTNDIGEAVGTSLEAGLTASRAALANITTLVAYARETLGAMVLLVIPPPRDILTGLGATTTANHNVCIAELRRGLIRLCATSASIIPVDLYAGTIDATETNGGMFAGATTDGTHVRAPALVPVARSVANVLAQSFRYVDPLVASVQDDAYARGYAASSAVYKNRTRNTAFVGSQSAQVFVTRAGATVTGTMPTDWRLTNETVQMITDGFPTSNGASVFTGTANVTRTVPAGLPYVANWANLGRAARIQATFAGNGDGFKLTQGVWDEVTNWDAGFYQARIGIYVRAASTFRSLFLQWVGGSEVFNVSDAAVSQTYQLAAGDLIYLASGAIYLPSGLTGSNILSLFGFGQAGDTADIEVFAPEFRRIADPYA
jgi:lysophospholipase L1-like esterase